MYSKHTPALWLALLFLLCSSVIEAASAPEFDLSPAFRYRAHQVSDDARGDAFASSIKLRLNAEARFGQETSLFAQFDHVYVFNDGDFNSVVVTRATSPIPEAKGSEINNLGVKTNLTPELTVLLGRQSLSHDNERHIGAIEFWQKSQTFDAVTLRYQNFFGVSLEYAYIDQVNRIFGHSADTYLSKDDIRYNYQPLRPAGELGEHTHDSHLLRGQYRISNTTKLIGYAYLLDNQSMPLFSSNTLGIRLEQSVKPNEIKFAWVAEGAIQRDNANNPVNYQTYYAMLQGGMQYKSHLLELTAEYIGEDSGVPFATSLGTNHKFQGWADVFTDYNPNGGLVDYSLGYRGRKGKIRWRVIYHHYMELDGVLTIGNEWDAEFAYRVDRKWDVKLVYAAYSAKSGQLGNIDSQTDSSTAFLSVNYNL